MVEITRKQIELSQILAPHVPWKAKVGDAYQCKGFPRVVWALPAPCHADDFLIWGLYEAKLWLHEHGMDDLEFVQSSRTCTMTARNRSTNDSISTGGATDVEAALEAIVAVLKTVD